MKKSFSLLLLIAVALIGCNFAGNAPDAANTDVIAATQAPTELPFTATYTPSPAPPSPTPSLTPSDEASPQPSATSAIFPVLTFATDAVCRMGPGKRYYAVLSISKGMSFEVSGRNADSSWLAVQATRIGDDCWVPASSMESPGNLGDLNVIGTQSLPGEPMNVTASDNPCGVVNHLWLYWVTVDAIGYRIYRNGKEIATVYGGKYRDLDTPRTKLPTAYLYEIEAYNASGVSARAGISVTVCD